MIDVFIADDHTMLVQGLTKAIDESGKARVSRFFFRLQDCRRELAARCPDVLLLDISMPDGSGIDFCKEVTERYPSLKVIALTSHDEYSVARRMLANGAQGYVLKNASSEELVEAIENVYRGEKYVCDEISRLMKNRPTDGIFLNVREKKMLKLIVQGCTTPEMANRLCYSEETVKSYRKDLLAKLGVKNTAMLVSLAVEEGLV